MKNMNMKNMKKLWVISHHPSKPCAGWTKAELEASLDMDKVVEEAPNLDQAFLYEADSAEDAVRKMSNTVFGPRYVVSAREFTDAEYKAAFERTACRKIEWLADALGIGIADAIGLFDKLSNKKLNLLVESLAGKTLPKVSYK